MRTNHPFVDKPKFWASNYLIILFAVGCKFWNTLFSRTQLNRCFFLLGL